MIFDLLLKNTMKPISKGLLRSPYERDNPAKNLRKVATIRWIP